MVFIRLKNSTFQLLGRAVLLLDEVSLTHINIGKCWCSFQQGRKFRLGYQGVEHFQDFVRFSDETENLGIVDFY